MADIQCVWLALCPRSLYYRNHQSVFVKAAAFAPLWSLSKVMSRVMQRPWQPLLLPVSGLRHLSAQYAFAEASCVTV